MNIEQAIAYLKEQDLAAMEVGKYFVDDDFYYMIQEYDSKEPGVARLEAHRVYADIQWVISGEEIIETVGLPGLVEKDAYNPEKDIIFFEKPGNMEKQVLHAGDYMVLKPDLAHAPGQRINGTSIPIKKCVAKVRM